LNENFVEGFVLFEGDLVTSGKNELFFAPIEGLANAHITRLTADISLIGSFASLSHTLVDSCIFRPLNNGTVKGDDLVLMFLPTLAHSTNPANKGNELYISSLTQPNFATVRISPLLQDASTQQIQVHSFLCFLIVFANDYV
jgi:hypothetical protein